MKNLQNEDFNIHIISDIVLEPHISRYLEIYFGKTTKVHLIPYDEYTYEGYRKQIQCSDIIIVWLNLSVSYAHIFDVPYAGSEHQIINEIISSCEKLYNDISIYQNSQIMWFSFDDYFNILFSVTGYRYNALADTINTKLDKIFKDNVSVVDFKHIIAKVGITKAYDSRGKYRWNAPYSREVIESATKEIHKQYLVEKGVTKKCLILDCDNVLWGGIISEDGIYNIKLSETGVGRFYQDFQRFLLFLYYHGVILAICSKNDLSDVLTMFHDHSAMILKEEHIACFQVNWKNKCENIKTIAEKLNIGLESMVFVDDSKVEIEAVKSAIPSVTTILFGRDIQYEQFSCFNLKKHICISDVEKRNATYRTDGFREELRTSFSDYSDYIKALDIKIDIHEATPIEYNRLSELTQRTNRCTNGKRYTITDIRERVTYDSVHLYSVSVSDRFSDLGIVGVFETEDDTLTLFSLSCRALGREIEKKMLTFISNKKYGIKTFEFNSTGKNEEFKFLLLDAFPNT